MGHGARVKAHTSDEDLGWRNIEKQVRLVRKNPYVMIGVQEGAGTVEAKDGDSPQKNPITVALLASVHEFGSAKRKIPERSFIRSTMDQHASEFHAATESLINQIIDGAQTVENALKILGLLIQSKIKKKIQSNISPALKPSTLFRRNAEKIDKAKKRVTALSARAESRGYRSAQNTAKTTGPMNHGSYSPKMTEKEKSSLNSAANLIISGGSGTALIDSGQLINSILYQVIMENAGFSDASDASGEIDMGSDD